MQEPLCILGKRQTVLQMALHLQQRRSILEQQSEPLRQWYRQQTHKGLPDTENKKRGISWHKTWNASFLRLISQNIEKNLVIFPIYRYIKLKYNELRKNAKIIYFREERGNAAKDSI